MSNPIGNVDLDMLAYDIADLMDRNQHGLDEVGQDAIRAALPAFLEAALAHARAEAAPGPVGPTQHNHELLPFGRKLPKGECPRCDELHDGAPARERFGGRPTSAQQDAERSAEITAHFASDRHRSGGCGMVCTFGDY